MVRMLRDSPAKEHGRQGDQQRERNGERDDDGQAEPAQKEEQHQRRQHPPDQAAV